MFMLKWIYEKVFSKNHNCFLLSTMSNNIITILSNFNQILLLFYEFILIYSILRYNYLITKEHKIFILLLKLIKAYISYQFIKYK